MISEDNDDFTKKTYKIESIQQEIYKQLRLKLDSATKDFNDGQYEKLKKELEDDV